MLHWRLLLGVLIIAALVGLCWLDDLIPVPGAVLMPLALVLAVMATGEVLRLLAAAGMRPSAGPVYAGNVLMVAAGWISIGEAAPSTLTLLALGTAVLLIFTAEMRRYEKPGDSTKAVAAGVFAVVYVGLLMSFVVSLRMTWGMAALASMLIVVKLGDTGAYTVGRLIGRHKMAPVLSPGKTIEGAVGALVFSVVGSWATFHWLAPLMAGGSPSAHPIGWGWLAYGLAVSAAGMLGDLAESLLKRNAGLKDSSHWLPGFGGILDVLDSILLAAPVAYAFWAFGLVG
jgi:phosphatidate cytidylyltransferase